MHLVASSGMDYLLGGNALGQSYVTGYGVDCSRHQRRRPLVLVATYLDSTTARELLFVPLSLPFPTKSVAPVGGSEFD